MKRGDVVLARFPHVSGTPAKARPVLVVQGNYYNSRIHNVLLASITTNLNRKGDAAHYFIEASTAIGKRAGLRHDSLVSCLNIAVLRQSHTATKIGELPPDAMIEIDRCLKTAFGIP